MSELDENIDLMSAEIIHRLADKYYNAPYYEREKAAVLYEKAASLGYAPSKYALGCMYFWAEGVDADEEMAFRLILSAAEDGYFPAQKDLAGFYEHGHGVDQSYSEAVKWYFTALDNADGSDRDLLGDLQRSLASLYERGLGVPKDTDKATQWYEKSAALGNPMAKARLKKLKNE